MLKEQEDALNKNVLIDIASIDSPLVKFTERKKKMQEKRWASALAADQAKLMRFLKKQARSQRPVGEIHDFTPPPCQSCKSKDRPDVKEVQIFRNCAGYQQVFEFGHNYVSLGFLDLWQLMDGTYLHMDKGVLKFYGFDNSELAVARSLLVLELTKAPFEEICSKTILQVWFSSSWDEQTKDQFTSFLELYLTTSSSLNNPLLKKYAKVWLKKMANMSADKEGQSSFTLPIPDNFFHPLLNLKREEDRVRYMR